MNTVLQFPANQRTPVWRVPYPASGARPLIIEIPVDLAARIDAVAMWSGKSASRFALDMLADAFPADTGGIA